MLSVFLKLSSIQKIHILMQLLDMKERIDILQIQKCYTRKIGEKFMNY